MKRPSFQFYPADWRKDPALSACSLAARGLWIELMCVAHEGDNYGVLSINGNPMSVAQIARLVGESPVIVNKLLAELESAGVFSRDEQGCVYSRRMVKDERIRNIRAESGRLGGNPNLLKQKGKQKDKQTSKQNLTPSSSSSSSSNTPIPPDTGGSTANAFEQFWRAYPKKVGKDAAQKAFARRKPDKPMLEAMLAAVSVQASSEQWRRDGGQFVPNPATWLNQGRWKDGESSAETAVLEGFV